MAWTAGLCSYARNTSATQGVTVRIGRSEITTRADVVHGAFQHFVPTSFLPRVHSADRSWAVLARQICTTIASWSHAGPPRIADGNTKRVGLKAAQGSRSANPVNVTEHVGLALIGRLEPRIRRGRRAVRRIGVLCHTEGAEVVREVRPNHQT